MTGPRLSRATAAAVALVFLLNGCRGGCATEPLSDEQLAAMTTDALATAVRIRGLAPPPEGEGFAQETTSRGALAAYIERRVADADVERVFGFVTRMLVDLGALDAGEDLTATYKRAALEAIAGYYDWEDQTLYVADWIPANTQRPVLIHELTHALQDYHFGLGRFMRPLEGYDDAQSAVAALIEGDATLVMHEATLEGRPDADKRRHYQRSARASEAAVAELDAPPVVAESILFPYRGGLRFVRAAYLEGGWREVDALYEDLPLSTEQILHPQKRLGASRDYPLDLRVELPPALTGAGWREVYSTVNGELGLRTLFEQGLKDRARAAAAAAGWGGDRALLLEQNSDGPSLTLVASEWDSEADAAQAADALRQAPTPPQALTRVGTKVVGLWGAAVEDPEAVTEAVCATLRGDELRSFELIEARAARRRAHLGRAMD